MTRYLVDTNVLLRGAVNTSARNSAAAGAISTLLARGDELLLAPPVLIESWSVASWPIDVVRTEINSLLDQFPLLPETPAVFGEWLQLVTQHSIVGKQVHDARLVAFLHIHQVDRLLTFNTNYFRSYGVTVVSPDDILVPRATP